MSTASELAERLVEKLKQLNQRIVFAESCTAGLVAATMGQIPGVSNYLCGSAVTYRSETKVAWLQIDQDELAEHTAVSGQVTESMARSVLRTTPEASLAVTVTGHLGPDAPPELDGVVFVCAMIRASNAVTSKKVRMQSSDRISRQQEAVVATLEHALAAIS